jgi:Protein of unknown function (DUF3108).
MNRHLPLLAIGMLLACSMARAAEPVLPKIDLFYDVEVAGIGVGQAEFRLTPEKAHADCYQYVSATHPIGVVRLLLGEPVQQSWFCLRDGRIVPQRAESNGGGNDYRLDFHWSATGEAGEVVDAHGGKRKVPAGAVDAVSLPQAVRLWVIAHVDDAHPPEGRFVMVDDHSIQTDRFRIAGQAQVQVPAGRFDTVLVERVDDPHKVAKFWLAPKVDYMPVRAEQKNGGAPTIVMRLARRSGS